MKIMQVGHGFCCLDVTQQCPTLQDVQKHFGPNLTFIEVPDYVFEGWGYDDTQTGDACFIKPVPPEGWLYNETLGIIEPEFQEPIVIKEEAIPDVEILKQQIALLQEQLNALEQTDDSNNETELEPS